MATVSAPRNRSGPARNRSSLPSQVAVSAPPPAAHTSSHLVNRIAYAKIESAPDEAQLPSLLEEAEILAKSFEALQSNGSAAQQKSAQDRAARRASRRGRPDNTKAEKLPVYSAHSSSRNKRRTASRASTSGCATATPLPDSTVATAGLSARRTQRARGWGKAKSDQQVEHTWSGIATQTRVTSLKPKEELDLTTRLKKYFKLQDRYDSLTDSLGYSPTMEEFARRLGTKNVSKISAIMSDGPRQKAAMVRHNMGLVVNIINKYDHRHVTKEEMTSAAVEGLVHAIKLFDPAKGFKFSTYAHWWVRQSVNKILSVESRVVYVPQNVYELSIQAANVTAKLQPKYFPDSVPEEKVAEEMGVTLSRLREIRSAVREPVNMNQPVGADNATEIGELISDQKAVRSDDSLIEESMEQAVDSYLQQLTAREAGVLRMRYGLGGFERPHTLEEIGFRYAVTRERIRQIEMKAFGWLKRSSFSEELKVYTEEQDVEQARQGSAIHKKHS